MPLRRFRLRTLMIVVAVAALISLPGSVLVRKLLSPSPTGRVYYGKYVAPDGSVFSGTVIFVRSDGVVFVD